MANENLPLIGLSDVERSLTDNVNLQRARRKITGQQIRTVLVSSTGFFMDAYDIFVINLVVPMLGYVYYSNQGNTVPSDIQGILKGTTNVGNFFGQIIFGILGDSKGRKSIYGIELLIIILATLGSAMAGAAPVGVGVIGFLGFWRFLLGIGIGGDYPMSATVSSEWSSEGRRGQMLALTFSMQGWGQFFGALVDIILLAIFKKPIETAQVNIDYVWRMLLGIGVVPAVCTIYSRFHLPESARYAEQVLKDAKLVAKGKAYALGKDLPDLNTHEASNSIPHQDDAPKDRKHLKEFCSYFSHWCNFKVLLGTCSTWFLLDIAFYGLSLNQSVVLSAIGFAPDSATTLPWETLWKQAIGNLIITLLGSIPGYYVTVFTVEYLGRKTIQIIGFTMEVILFTIVAAAFYTLEERAEWAFIVLFVLIQFFFQFGANATTFIIPAEVFPTRFRATAHGLSAACGKAGAILAAFGFNVLVDLNGKNSFLPQTLGIFAGIQFVGLIATIFLIPESKGKNLDDFEDNGSEGQRNTSPNRLATIEQENTA
jgi:PHS family inorganic phosphate transporter-like MFS transporter